VSDVASEVHASAKTIHRRLERMTEKELVDLSIDWYPDVSNDIVALCHVTVAKHADRMKVLSELKERFPQNVMIDLFFSNLLNQVVLFLWTNSMRQMDDLREGISGVPGVKTVILNVLQIGYMFDTWRDKLVLQRGKSVAAMGG
jgi:hypothetical protein